MPSISALYFSAVKGVRASVQLLPVKKGGVVGDRKFNPKDEKGRRELLGVDSGFTGVVGDHQHGENIVFEGLDLHKLEEGSIIKVCPSTAQSKKNVAHSVACPGKHRGDAACNDYVSTFVDGLLTLRRQCVKFEVLGKRNCKGSAEEAQGRRGVFLRTIRGNSAMADGTIAVGDDVTIV